MYIQQLYTNCLAQAAYYVESNGEALIIDPLREPEPYLAMAKQRNARIRYVFETHFHADFVSGHVELERQTGALIIYGPNAKPKYKAFIAEDNETFELGKIKFRVIHTPGHTIESSCLLLLDENGRENCIFSGDTLFSGEVGRPDLLSGNLDKETLAEMLYNSLQKLRKLPNDLIVYPGHGAGSACGKNIGKELTTTIGDQKKKNYAFNVSKKEFIEMVTTGLPTPPAYFFKDAGLNISGYDSYETIVSKEMNALNVEQFKKEIERDSLILDTRDASEFAKAFIPGSINIGLNGDFAVWCGTVIEFGTPLILVTEKGKEKKSIVRLARIGFDSIQGYLNDGIQNWIRNGCATDQIKEVNMDELNALDKKDLVVLDVRHNTEREKVSIPGSLHVPLSFLKDHLEELNKSKKYVVCCAGGYRSMIAAGLLKRKGFKNILNLKKGINAYQSSLI